MEHFAKNNIKVDLHIHSSDSYFWDGDVVKNSNISNVDVLLQNLEWNEINLFSITDHNKFNYELYTVLKEKIKSSEVINNILPGIEFSVVLEEDKKPCHIITIFDNSSEEKLKNIQNVLDEQRSINQGDAYSLNEFNEIIRSIGLNTILIVHQKHDFDKPENDNSFTDSCSDPSIFIKTGYFDCLEFGNSKSEGVVKNCLRKIDYKIPLITGSDCHDWDYYPNRDKDSKRKDLTFTEFRCLPTFRGLVVALSSFSNRVNYAERDKNNVVSFISINGNDIPLSSGINAIIGDNGSGKTLLITSIAKNSPTKYNKIIKKNDIKIKYSNPSFQNSKMKHIYQGQINEQVVKGGLFNGAQEYFKDVDTLAIFRNKISNYFNLMDSYIQNNIKVNDTLVKLKNMNIDVAHVDHKFYFPHIINDIKIDDSSDIEARRNFLHEKFTDLVDEFRENSEFYKSMGMDKDYVSMLSVFVDIYNNVNYSYFNNYINCKAKAFVIKALKAFSLKIDEYQNSKEKYNSQKVKDREIFSDTVVELCKLINNIPKFPDFPNALNGQSCNQVSDYNFIKTAMYHNVLLEDEFYDFFFNSSFNSVEKVKAINNLDDYTEALKGYSNKNDFVVFCKDKVNKFVDNWSKVNTTISEVATGDPVGNTPGENSLVYYKFITEDGYKDYDVLLIDQPEDDINPYKINKDLITYLSRIRFDKQVIIATHNPLLVVNLDVDNIIFVKNIDNNLDIEYGALEYDEEYSIVNKIRDNLDGGYEAIEKRIKNYERD